MTYYFKLKHGGRPEERFSFQKEKFEFKIKRKIFNLGNYYDLGQIQQFFFLKLVNNSVYGWNIYTISM